jgi:cell division transport system permease protein
LSGGPGQVALPLPRVIAIRVADDRFDLAALAARLQTVAEGTLVESQDVWIHRLSVLARSLQACAALAMGVVGFVAVAVVMVATRAGLAARREAIEIVHGLGATDRFIAGRFANRATRLAALGALAGAVLALPVLLGLAALAAPFAGGPSPDDVGAVASGMPPVLWVGLPQLTVRRWLRRLP